MGGGAEDPGQILRSPGQESPETQISIFLFFLGFSSRRKKIEKKIENISIFLFFFSSNEAP